MHHELNYSQENGLMDGTHGGERGVNMDSLIDVISIVIFFGLIMYAAIKLDEAARRLNDVEERIYRERKLK